MSSYDFLIIGAGYAGLMAASTLARSGAKVALADSSHIGGDPSLFLKPSTKPFLSPTQSMISGGHVVIGFCQDYDNLVERYGEAFAQKFIHLSIDGVNEIEKLCQSIEGAEFRRGYLILARNQRDEDAFQKMFRESSKYDIPTSTILKIHTSGETQKLVSSPEFTRSSFYSNLSGQLEPQYYLAGLARIANALGVEFKHQTRINHIVYNKDMATVTTDTQDTISARHVIISGGTGILRSRLFPVMRQYQAVIGNYALKTDILPDTVLNKIFPTGYPGAFCDMRRTDVLYARLDKDNRLDFGAYSFSGQKPNSAEVIALLYRTFPQLQESGIGVHQGRYGYLCGTKLETMQMFQSRDNGQIFPSHYFDPSARLTILSAFGGAGINLGTTAGRGIAQAYSGSPETINLLAKIRHPKLPITFPSERANQARDYALTKALSIIDRGASQDGIWGKVMRRVEELI